MKNSRWMLIPLLLAAAGCASAGSEIPAVTGFEVEKYLGKWYEFARLPNWFERKMTDVSADYSRLPDGSLEVINRGMKNGKSKSVTGKLRFADKNDIGELEVSFFTPFYSSYRIIKLAPDYRYSVVISGNGKYLWILSRTRKLDEADLVEIIDFLKKNNVPLEDLLFL